MTETEQIVQAIEAMQLDIQLLWGMVLWLFRTLLVVLGWLFCYWATTPRAWLFRFS